MCMNSKILPKKSICDKLQLSDKKTMLLNYDINIYQINSTTHMKKIDFHVIKTE